MFVMNNFLQENNEQISALEEKLSDYLPLEQFLRNDEAILCVKACGEKTKEYLNSSKIKKLIKLITEEPEDDNQIRGHKIPYIASEILKLDCPYILDRFILSEKEYDEKYNNNNKQVENKVDGAIEKTGNEKENKADELNNDNIGAQNDSQKENNMGKENNKKNAEEYKFIDSDEDSEKDSNEDSDKENNKNDDKKEDINENKDLKIDIDENKSNDNNDEEKGKQNINKDDKHENSDKENEKLDNEKEGIKKELEDKGNEDKNKDILKENEIEEKKHEDIFNIKNDKLTDEKKEEEKKIEEEKK
jgi:hypothetical protein